MGREFELKYAATQAHLALLQGQYPQVVPFAMETIYYDTPDGGLSARHWTLRRRMENGQAVCSVKIPLPDGSRGEWETEEKDIEKAIPVLCLLGAPEELKTLTADGIVESCGARFTRLAGLVKLKDATVEIALDRGLLMGGGKEQPFAEVEVELKSGSDAAAVAFAENLAKEWNLQRQYQSKFARARALAGGKEGDTSYGL